jgi:O-antigen/teichoic acid export membrane protein
MASELSATRTSARTAPPPQQWARLRRSVFAREGGLTVGWGLGVYALSLVTGPALARALGADGRGSVAAVVVPAQVVAHLLAFGTHIAAGYLSERIRREDLLVGVAFTSLVVGGPVVAVLWMLVPAYLSGHDAMTVMFLRVFLVQTLLTVPAFAVIEMHRARSAGLSFNVLRTLPLVLNTLLVIALFVSGALTLVSALVSAIAAVIVSDAVALTTARLRRPFTLGMKTVRRLWSFGARTWLGTLSNTVVGRLDQLLLVALAAPDELGLYAVAVSAANVTLPIGQGAAYAVLPTFRRGELSTLSDVRNATVAVFAVTTAVCVVLALAGPVAIPLLFGDDFRGAVRPLLLLLPGQAIGAAGEVLKADLVARGHPGKGSICQGLAAAVTLAFLPPAVLLLGIEGAAIVTTLAYGGMTGSAILLDVRLHRNEVGHG